MDSKDNHKNVLEMLNVDTGLSRRSVLKLLGATATLPVTASLLAACGGGDEDEPSEASGGSEDDESDESESPDADEGSDDESEGGEGSQSEGEPQRGGTLLLAVSQEPDSLDPASTIQAVASSVQTHIYDRLVYIDEDRLPQPWLAEDWELSDDGTELTFHLRSGVMFHDDTEVNADAVKHNFDRILDPDMASPALAQMGSLQEVEVVDDYSVIFRFEEPYAPFFTNIAISYGGIVSPAGVEEHGDQFGRNPVGSGPFKFREWQTGQHIVLDRFEGYVNYRGDDQNDGEVYVDGLEIQFISDVSTRLAALQSGELHISDVDRAQAPGIEEDPNYNIVLWEDATNYNFIEFVDREPFNQVAFKQAIACAIDRETIAASAYNGYATPNLLPMPSGLAGWDEELGREYGYPYDLERAQQILADDGWEPGDDGVLQKGDHRLDFTLLYYSGNEPIRVASEIIQATLEQIGMSVELQVMEFGALQGVIESGDFDINWMRWTWPDPVILSLLFKSPGWVGQVSDPDLDELLVAADTTVDPEARIDAVQEALRYILENAVVAPIVTDWIIEATRGEVHGYRLDTLGAARYNDVWIEQ